MGNLTVKESGEMVNFISPNVSKITSFKVHFSPKQEGTGDPSPDNVREITGWNGVEGYKCGKNLVPWISTRYICTADHYNGNTDWSKLWEIPKRISYTYSVFIDNSNCSTASAVRVWLRDIDNSKYTHYVTGEKINAGEKGFSTVTLDFSNLPNDYYAYWGLNLYQNAIASMPIVYESDQETVIISDWSSNIGTVYGGYVDLISGELVQTIKRVEFTWGDCEDSTILGNTERRYIMFNDNRFKTIDSLKTKISNIFSTFLDNSSWNVDKVSCAFGNKTIICKLPVGSDNNTIIQVAGDLATPITHQLTPQQLSTLKGQNNFWSNADYVEIEYELTETFDIQKAKRKIILNQPHVESVSDDLVTFDTDMKGKLKECKVYFSPVQEGEGYPSPDNVRNIVGWNGVRVGLPDEYQEVEWIQSTERKQFILLPYGFEETDTVTITASIGTEYSTDKFIIAPREWNNNNNRFAMVGVFKDMYCIGYGNHTTNYTCLEPTTNNDGNMHTWTFANKVFKITDLGLSIDVSNITFGGVTSNLKLFYGYNQNINGKLSYYKHVKLNGEVYEFIPCYRKSDGEIGLYDIKNHVFYTNDGTGSFLKGKDVNNITTNINWTDNIGTVYGGYVDAINGDIVADMAIKTFDGSETWNIATVSSKTAYQTRRPADIASGAVFTSNIITRVASLSGTVPNNVGYFGGTYLNVYALSLSLEEWIAMLTATPLQIVYKLVEPIHYQLTPQQILTLKGINNVYSDTNGQTEIKYWKH